MVNSRGNDGDTDVHDERKGTVVKLTGLAAKSFQNHKALKEHVGKFGEVSFVDFEAEGDFAFVRMGSQADAAKLVEGAAGDELGSAALLAGEEEETYWKKVRCARHCGICMPLIWDLQRWQSSQSAGQETGRWNLRVLGLQRLCLPLLASRGIDRCTDEVRVRCNHQLG